MQFTWFHYTGKYRTKIEVIKISLLKSNENLGGHITFYYKIKHSFDFCITV